MKKFSYHYIKRRLKEVMRELDRICCFMKEHILFLFVIFFILVGIFTYLTNESILLTSGDVKKLPIYCVDTQNANVAISFDSAWGNEDIGEILKILEKQNVKATFFMTGEWIKKYPKEVKQIALAGHDLGNHGMNHREMSKLTNEQCKEEIMLPHQLVKELTGIEMQLFRPPYGDYNNIVVEATNELGYHCIQWDVDSLDWKDYGKESIIDTVVNNEHLGNGSIILLHTGAKYTPSALEEVIIGLKNKGYEIVPISELIYTGDYYIDIQGRQFQNKE